MVAAKRKQVKKIRFELTRSGIGGIGVVVFCIFLWMFLLGVWTGQSLLMPSSLDYADGDDGSRQIVNMEERVPGRLGASEE